MIPLRALSFPFKIPAMNEQKTVGKPCPECGRVKAADEFGVNARRSDGLALRCKACTAEIARRNYRRRAEGQGREVRGRPETPEGSEGVKRCPDCEEVKELAEFGRNKSYPDGYGFYCKPCVRVRANRTYRERAERQGRKVREPVAVQPGFKWCPSCKQAVPHEGWDKNRQTKDGLASACKACRKERGARDHLKRSYGLTPEDVRKMAEFQGGLCAICGEGPAEHVDHDHETGAVRDMLCFNCNTLLGKAGDDWRRLQRAQFYLLWHKLGHIPVAERV